jgi:hypothetical protein
MLLAGPMDQSNSSASSPHTDTHSRRGKGDILLLLRTRNASFSLRMSAELERKFTLAHQLATKIELRQSIHI